MLPTSSLLCHPACDCAAVTALRAGTSRMTGGGLQLRYELSGALEALRIPAATHGGFADELWKHTCFEAFVSADEALAYREFNFSPGGQWAAYAFTDYRQRDNSWQASLAPQLATHLGGDTVVLDACIPQDLLPVASTTLHIGLTAVIETQDGAISYWALTHTAERPDFHPRASFTLHLAYPEQT